MSGVEVLAVVGSEVERQERMDRAAGIGPSSDTLLWRRTRAAIAELLAADKEYDEANAAYYDGCLLDRLPRLEAATARRASALAALEGSK